MRQKWLVLVFGIGRVDRTISFIYWRFWTCPNSSTIGLVYGSDECTVKYSCPDCNILRRVSILNNVLFRWKKRFWWKPIKEMNLANLVMNVKRVRRLVMISSISRWPSDIKYWDLFSVLIGWIQEHIHMGLTPQLLTVMTILWWNETSKTQKLVIEGIGKGSIKSVGSQAAAICRMFCT